MQIGNGYAEEVVCDDFTTYNWQPEGDVLGYCQQGMSPIVNVPYFDNVDLGVWDYSQEMQSGLYGVTSGASFSFDGSNQIINFEIYGFESQYNQMGFSLNGGEPIALDGAFPMVINGVIVDLDMSALNLPGWENAYLSFTGNVDAIEIYVFESGILSICVGPNLGDAICDDFTAFDWQPVDEILGYTQSGTYPLVNVPYFDNVGVGVWDYSQEMQPGLYGVTSGASFSFNGSNQIVTFEIYGFESQYNQIGFSVNGSDPIALDGFFPIVVDGITVDLDTSAPNLSVWENAYLLLTGNVYEIEIYAFESGILSLCSQPNTSIAACDDFTTYNWDPGVEILGYTQGGNSPIINVPYYNAPDANPWYFDQNNQPGMYGGVSGARFNFSGTNQLVRYEIYGLDEQYGQMGFSVNGSDAIFLDDNFPLEVIGVTIDLDLSAPNVGIWENAYLTFTGLVTEIQMYAFESGIISMCIETLTLIKSNNDDVFDRVNIYPNPAKDFIEISGINAGTIKIINLQGQIVKTLNAIAAITSVDISNLSSGIYMVQIQTDNEIIVKKIVKQ